MASRIRTGLCAALLAAPTALAFFSGGFFDEPRLWAAVLVWAGLALALATGAEPLPASRSGRACLAGLAGLTALTAVSMAWAPVRDWALADAERLLLYLGCLLAGVALLRERGAQRALEPALAVGVLVVVGYGVAGRLLPELVDAERSVRAGTRLDQPLTYWNAMGALAAMGAILALRVSSDATRGRLLRVAAAGAMPVLILGLYLTLSRGALAALAAGLFALVVLAGARRTAGSALVALVTGGLAVAAVTRFPAVETLSGGSASAQGPAMLAILVALVAAAALAQGRLVSAQDAGRSPLGRSPALAVAALVALAVCAAALATVVPAAGDESDRSPQAQPAADPGALPGGRARLRTLETNRLTYWDVALGAVDEAPLQGRGSGGFATLWLERRTLDEGVHDAHSIYIETLVELGIAGLCLLALFVAGAVAAARALRADSEGRELSAGWLAAGVVFLVHAGLDWDWEMPAVGLVFILVVAATLAARDALEPPRTASGPRSAGAT